MVSLQGALNEEILQATFHILQVIEESKTSLLSGSECGSGIQDLGKDPNCSYCSCLMNLALSGRVS